MVRLTFEGYSDGKIADRLKSTPGAVRNRRTRFRTFVYQAAREHRIRIPEQLHTSVRSSRHNPRGAK
ncbi:hypothetical protein ACFYWN_15865 [Streptomyces sp. NPDC002917]|uniref:hypothetical protein n=1 Tax=Streptomyces sp. NPDC002917 TaxID=3364671 RepID=UPI0036A02C4E